MSPLSSSSSGASKILAETNWTETSLGAYANWPNQLKATLLTCFGSSLPTAIYWGPQLHIFYNDAYAPIAGKKHPHAFGRPGAEVWQEIWPAIEQNFSNVIETAKGIALENQMLVMDRFGAPEDAFFDYSLSPIIDETGVVHGIHNIAFEITDRVLAERTAQRERKYAEQAKSQLLGVMENMSDACFVVDSDWNLVDVNRSHEKLSRIPRDQQLGRNFLKLFFESEESHNTKYWTEYHRAMSERVEVIFEDYYKDLDLWTLVTAYPTNNGGLAVFFKDISELKRASIKLERAQTDLSQAVEIADIGFWKIGVPTLSLQASSRFLKHFGLSENRKNLTMDDALAAVHSEDRPRVADAVHKSMYEGAAYHVDYRTVHVDGTIRWLEAKGATTYDESLKPVSFTGTSLDITERIRSRVILEEAKETAERANHLKSAFLANMSHEIRTPLGAMIGFADLLGDPAASLAEKANYIDILKRNGQQLGHVINDILDLSKVETGHISFEYLKVRPLQIAHEVVSLMGVVAKEKGLALSFEDDGTTPETLVSDPTRVKQVLMNLVSNALKFTKVGSIRLTLSGFEGRDGAKCCAFEVIDTGAGIPKDATDRLFRMFSQADNSMTRKYGGTGLGLALSRALARAMGGEVRLVSSEENVGSRFHFSVESREDLIENLTLVEEQRARESDLPLPPNVLENLRVLLIEDSPDNQQLIWRYLSRYGARIEIADNGSEGVSRALANEHDVVLMDLQMPVMDGYTAIGKLRSRGYRTPIIALTAHAMADVKKKCEDLGFDAHLPKPINSRELIEGILRAVGRKIQNA